jgi:enolase
VTHVNEALTLALIDSDARTQAGLRAGADVDIAADPASNEFFDAGRYRLHIAG